MTESEIRAAIEAALKNKNWIIRADNDGVAASGEARGFHWAPLGEWAEAPDWDPTPRCGGGLHGQDYDNGGYICGRRLVFCDTEGAHVVLGDKVKVRRARILMANTLPEGLTVGGSLYLSGTAITALPDGLTVGGWLDLRDTAITALPDGLTVGGGLDLRDTAITALPEGLTVGGQIFRQQTRKTDNRKGRR